MQRERERGHTREQAQLELLIASDRVDRLQSVKKHYLVVNPITSPQDRLVSSMRKYVYVS